MADISLMHFRREYLSGDMLEHDLLEDPHLQFLVWLEDAMRSGIDDPNAMSLATADKSGKPTARIVLLKDARPEGLVFVTNFESRKGRDLEENPRAAALFFWPGLERQLRVEGIVKKLTDEESDAFFNARPPQSRIAAIISEQSKVIPDREYLENKYNEWVGSQAGDAIARPVNWGAFIIDPSSYEFWQGRENRLHDRLRYTRTNTGWAVERLAP